jgi:hypothetical protein
MNYGEGIRHSAPTSDSCRTVKARSAVCFQIYWDHLRFRSDPTQLGRLVSPPRP